MTFVQGEQFGGSHLETASEVSLCLSKHAKTRAFTGCSSRAEAWRFNQQAFEMKVRDPLISPVTGSLVCPQTSTKGVRKPNPDLKEVGRKYRFQHDLALGSVRGRGYQLFWKLHGWTAKIKKLAAFLHAPTRSQSSNPFLNPLKRPGSYYLDLLFGRWI